MAQRLTVDGDIIDAPLPDIDPEWTPEEIVEVATQFAEVVAGDG